MDDGRIPLLSELEIDSFLKLAGKSDKRRFPKLLHSPGDEFNSVFNFIMQDSYMQPHLHPGDEKIEKIHVIRGRVAVLYFNDRGEIVSITVLERGGLERIDVPAFTWHTYIMLTDFAVTYETMMGVYNPETWKKFASWAPQEGSVNCADYLESLKLGFVDFHRQ